MAIATSARRRTRAAASGVGGFDLDLVVRLDRPGPASTPLAEVRRVLEGLYGGPLPAGWDHSALARWGTGREALTGAARAELGEGAGRFPLFG